MSPLVSALLGHHQRDSVSPEPIQLSKNPVGDPSAPPRLRFGDEICIHSWIVCKAADTKKGIIASLSL